MWQSGKALPLPAGKEAMPMYTNKTHSQRFHRLCLTHLQASPFWLLGYQPHGGRCLSTSLATEAERSKGQKPESPK